MRNMMIDCTGIPIRDHDCVVELTEEFARYGADGLDLNYGIVYGTKWVLPLHGMQKKQIASSDYIRLLNTELMPEIEEQLYSLYAYYRKYQRLPEQGQDIVSEMQEDVAAFRAQHIKVLSTSPFIGDTTSEAVNWTDSDEGFDDDLIL